MEKGGLYGAGRSVVCTAQTGVRTTGCILHGRSLVSSPWTDPSIQPMDRRMDTFHGRTVHGAILWTGHLVSIPLDGPYCPHSIPLHRQNVAVVVTSGPPGHTHTVPCVHMTCVCVCDARPCIFISADRPLFLPLRPACPSLSPSLLSSSLTSLFLPQPVPPSLARSSLSLPLPPTLASFPWATRIIL